MRIDTPNPADIAKLHAEVNQYINQRLTVVTNAITIFGVTIGWIVFGSSTSNTSLEVRPITFLLPTVLLIVLFVLFVYCQAIRGNIRILAGYLRATEASSWEVAVKKFTNTKSFFAQENIIPVMFFVLGACVGTIVFLLWWSFPPTASNSYDIGVSSTFFVITWAAYLLAVFLAEHDVFLNFGFNDEAEREWEELFKDRAVTEPHVEGKIELFERAGKIVPPSISDPETRRRELKSLVERMQKNPIPPNAPRLTREMLYERD